MACGAGFHIRRQTAQRRPTLMNAGGGAGGQTGSAEPATGISFALLQMGDSDQIKQFVRGAKMSQLALQLAR